MVSLNALIIDSVKLVAGWRSAPTILKASCQLIVFIDKLVDFWLNQTVLLVQHLDVSLECLWLSKQFKIVIISTEIQSSLLLDFFLKLLDNRSLFIDCVLQCRIVVTNMTSLLLDYKSLILNLVNLRVLSFQLVLDALFFKLQLIDLVIQLIQFELLSLNLLVVVSELLLAFAFLTSNLF